MAAGSIWTSPPSCASRAAGGRTTDRSAALTPKQILEAAVSEPFHDKKGKPLRLELLPAIAAQEIRRFETDLPAPVPPGIRELLEYAGGFRFDHLETEVDFLGSDVFAFEEALPHGVPLVGDGCGNYWVLDVHPGDGRWGHVFYVCHDPLALIVQAPSLAVFLEQIFDAARGKPDPLQVVRTRTAPRGSGTIDLSAGEIGSGFGFGVHDDIRRLSAEPVFEIRQPPPRPGFLDRLRGGWSG